MITPRRLIRQAEPLSLERKRGVRIPRVMKRKILLSDMRLQEPSLNQQHTARSVERRMQLLRTQKGKIIYLEHMLAAAGKKEGMLRVLSRTIEAAQSGSDSRWANFLTGLSRKVEGVAPALIKREVEVSLRAELERINKEHAHKREARLRQSAEKKQIQKAVAPQRTDYAQVFANLGHPVARQELLKTPRVVTLDMLSKDYERKSPQDKITYLNEKMQRTDLPSALRKGLQREVSLLQREVNLSEALLHTPASTTVDGLLREANANKNPEIRKRLVAKAKQLAKKSGASVPLEARMIAKYGFLDAIQLAQARTFERITNAGGSTKAAPENNALNFAQVDLAGKTLRGTPFARAEGIALARKLVQVGEPVKAARLLLSAGLVAEAESVARREERQQTRIGVMNALNIRKMLARNSPA